MKQTKKRHPAGSSTAETTKRKERLSAALRSNLRKRKEQNRARKGAGKSTG